MVRLGRFCLLIALIGALALVPHGRVYASYLPPWVTCQSTGSGSSCSGNQTTPDQSFTLTSCGSGASAFDVVLTYTLYWDVKAKLNEEGVLVADEFHLRYPDQALVNSVTGTTIPIQSDGENDSFTFTYDSSGKLVAVTRAQSGHPTQITLPGYGVVAHIDGLGVFNDFTGQLITGDHPQVVGAIDTTDICAALS